MSYSASASPPYPGALVNRGDRGATVRAVQARLNAELDGRDLTVNGRFDRRTELAVQRFQRSEGLDVDGDVGPTTWAALFDRGQAAASAPFQSPNAADAADAAAARAAQTPPRLRQPDNAVAEIKLRTFIPTEAIGVPYPSETINGANIRTTFSVADDTSASASFRTSQAVTVAFDGNGNPVPKESSVKPNKSVVTELYNKEDARQLNSWAWDLNEGAMPVARAQVNPDDIGTPSIFYNKDTAFVTFELSAINPLPPPFVSAGSPPSTLFPPIVQDILTIGEWVTLTVDRVGNATLDVVAPPIDARMQLELSATPNGDILYKASGRHDAFPAYELIINNQIVYGYNPVEAGNGPISLFGLDPYVFATGRVIGV